MLLPDSNTYILSCISYISQFLEGLCEETDLLHDLIPRGARDLIFGAVETELEALLAQYSDTCAADDRRAAVRNGHLML